jgi:hypothetical protein
MAVNFEVEKGGTGPLVFEMTICYYPVIPMNNEEYNCHQLHTTFYPILSPQD